MRKSRGRSSKSTFLSTPSRFLPTPSPPLPFPLTPCLYPARVSPRRFLHLPSPSPSSRIFPSAFSYTHIRPPVSLLSFSAPPPSCRHPREPSELSEPLWISPYATYWAQDVLRVVRERNLRAREMNPVKRPVAFINIAAGAFIRRASIYRVLDARPALPVSLRITCAEVV